MTDFFSSSQAEWVSQSSSSLLLYSQLECGVARLDREFERYGLFETVAFGNSRTYALSLMARWLMRNLSLGCILIPLVLSSSLTAQDTGFIRLRQPDSPAQFVRTTNNVKEDLLKFATLKNVSDMRLTGYRIGWVAVFSQGKEKIGLGLPVDVREGIDPGQIVDVPAQGVSPNLITEGASSVVFFVAETRTSNGATWKPNIDHIEIQARQMAALAPSN